MARFSFSISSLASFLIACLICDFYCNFLISASKRANLSALSPFGEVEAIEEAHGEVIMDRREPSFV
jgi:hypothetical protein